MDELYLTFGALPLAYMSGFKCEIDTGDLKAFVKALRSFPKALVGAPHRTALLRSGKTARAQSARDLQAVRRLKISELKEQIKLDVSGSGTQAEGRLRFMPKEFSMLKFVKGRKTPSAQRGVPVKARKRLRVEVERGKVKTLSRSFIARVKRRSGDSNYLVLVRSRTRTAQRKVAGYRKPQTKQISIKRTVTGLSHVIRHNDSMRLKIQDLWRDRYELEFERAFRVRLDKSVERYSRTRKAS